MTERILVVDDEKPVREILAALLRHRARFAGLRVGAVLSGGNVDLDAVGDLFGASGTARS